MPAALGTLSRAPSCMASWSSVLSSWPCCATGRPLWRANVRCRSCACTPLPDHLISQLQGLEGMQHLVLHHLGLRGRLVADAHQVAQQLEGLGVLLEVLAVVGAEVQHPARRCEPRVPQGPRAGLVVKAQHRQQSMGSSWSGRRAPPGQGHLSLMENACLEVRRLGSSEPRGCTTLEMGCSLASSWSSLHMQADPCGAERVRGHAWQQLNGILRAPQLPAQAHDGSASGSRPGPAAVLRRRPAPEGCRGERVIVVARVVAHDVQQALEVLPARTHSETPPGCQRHRRRA